MQMAIISVPTFSNKENIINGSLASALIIKAFKKATFIPNNATNGDMIKTLFPNEEMYEQTPTMTYYGMMRFDTDWWNAPYKKEVEE